MFLLSAVYILSPTVVVPVTIVDQRLSGFFLEKAPIMRYNKS